MTKLVRCNEWCHNRSLMCL